MLITDSLLTKHKACTSQVAIFKQQWPDGAELTEDNLMTAQTLGLNIHWFIHNVFPQHMGAYQKARAPHWEAYQKAITPHWEAYQKARAPHWEAYQKAITPHWEAYEKAVATLVFNLLKDTIC